MSSDFAFSMIGKERIDFIYGGFTMSHTIGAGQPWKKKVILDVIKNGKDPRLVDKQYWKYVQSPIKLYPYIKLFLKELYLIIETFITRIL